MHKNLRIFYITLPNECKNEKKIATLNGIKNCIGITEELKARDQMKWVRAVNNIRNAAEEIVLKELVYI